MSDDARLDEDPFLEIKERFNTWGTCLQGHIPWLIEEVERLRAVSAAKSAVIRKQAFVAAAVYPEKGEPDNARRD